MRTRNRWPALAGLLLAAALRAQVPQLPETGWSILDDCSYADDKAAQAAWTALPGSAPAEQIQAAGRRILKLPCNLADTTMARASWDRRLPLDLSACRGIRFRFFCPDLSPIRSFGVFLRSGPGWYVTSFVPRTEKAWNTVVLDKSEMRVDTGTPGTPAGFDRIDTIRISAWRGENRDTELYIADIGLLGTDAKVAVLRADAIARQSPQKAKSLATFTGTITRFLGDLDIPFAVIGDLDVNAERLAGRRVIVLVLDHKLPRAADQALAEFVNKGGKLVCFFGLPPACEPLVGLRRGGYVRQERPGQFASIRFRWGALYGVPPVVEQRSRGVSEALPVPGQGKILAQWHDQAGNPTDKPAVIASSNCLLMTHVLLNDDPAGKRRMLLAFLGRFVPELWDAAADTAIRRIGDLAGFANFAQAYEEIRVQAGHRPEAVSQLRVAQRFRQEAVKQARSGRPAKAIDAAEEARAALLRAYCSVQQPFPENLRAFWTHEVFGLPGWGWDRSIKLLAENGFTAIIPNLARAGTAYYPSRVLPAAPEVEDRGDQLAQCLAACRKYGLQLHVWKVNYNTAGWSSQEFLAKLRAEGRLQVSSAGIAGEWLCPSHPANQRLEIDSMLEIATRYPVDGIHFDYIRYPDGDHCFCRGCRARFAQVSGIQVANWPGDLIGPNAVPESRKKWLQFRRDTITAVVAEVSRRVREIKPDLKISAAVFRDWPSARDTNGQDWALWCRKGYLDFVCPMNYTASDVEFARLIPAQQKWAAGVPCYPGIGLLEFGARPDRAISQIEITRRHNTGGFVIWQYSPSQNAQVLVPLLGRGVTASRVPRR